MQDPEKVTLDYFLQPAMLAVEVLMATMGEFEKWLVTEMAYRPTAAAVAIRQARAALRGSDPPNLPMREREGRRLSLQAYRLWEASLPPGTEVLLDRRTSKPVNIPEALQAYHAWEGGGDKANRRVQEVMLLLQQEDAEKMALERGQTSLVAWSAFLRWCNEDCPSAPRKPGPPRKKDEVAGLREWLIATGSAPTTAAAAASRARSVLKEAAERDVTPEEYAGGGGPDAAALEKLRAYQEGLPAPAPRQKGRPRQEDGLDAFVAWLRTQGKAPATVAAVRGALRWVLREMSSTGKTGREVTFPMLSATDRQRRYAWYRYTDYAGDTGDPVAVAEKIRAATGLLK